MRTVQLVALRCGEGLEGADRHGRVEREQHPGCQEGIAAEQGHEPGDAGGDHGTLGMVGVEDAKGADVLGAGGQEGTQSLFGCVHQGRALAPGLVSSGGLAGLDGLAGDVTRWDLDAVLHRDHLNAH